MRSSSIPRSRNSCAASNTSRISKSRLTAGCCVGSVPSEGNLAKYKQMMKLTNETLDKGVSLIVFAEGTRAIDGRVGPFNPGVFRMAIQFGYPIAPMSIVGAYEFSKKGDWKLFPSKITVYIHDTIETKDLGKNDVETLMNRVHAAVAKPVDEYYGVDQRYSTGSVSDLSIGQKTS